MSPTNEVPADELRFLGSRVKVHLASQDNIARLSLTEHRMPEGYSPPRHLHRDEDETFYVLEGEMLVESGDARITVRAGETAHAPRGVPHSFRVTSPGGARCLTISTGGFEDFVREMSDPLGTEPSPDAAMLAAAAERHGIAFVGPPIA